MAKAPPRPTRSAPGSGDSGTTEGPHPHRYTARLANQIEARWQRHWHEHRTFAAPNPGDSGFDPSRPKFYCLDMFPYPSGVGLHVGHPLGYIATDILCRYRRMRGDNVLHPMGFDAFGLPAEQFAVEHGVHPAVTTQRNIDTMLRQLKALGLGYDWGRAFATTDVGYYRWTQWIFLKLYNSWYDPTAGKARPVDTLPAKDRDAHRLAYMAEVPVNWCPALGTVLANEEVTAEGLSERGNHPVFQRPLRQWMLRITAYADRLDTDLDLVDWPEAIKLMQRNWIGRSEGALIDFPIDGAPGRRPDAIRVFTTRPDTIFGATYLVLAPDHPLVDAVTTAAQKGAVDRYRREASTRGEDERAAQKTGVFTGGYVKNPATGKRIPVWNADYVIMGYGTGAIMAVPGHDQRDHDFALAFGLPIVRVVEGGEDGAAYEGDGPHVRSANSEVSLDGFHTREAATAITTWLERTGLGRAEVQYRLRDWLFSRQRYWGEPFPILHAPDGSIVALDERELPVELPEMTDFAPEASEPDDPRPPRPPLARAPESWRIVTRNGVRYQRELNTMPQWAGSCWYYLRFIDPRNDSAFVGKEAERYWMGRRGVDLYIGGVEHAVLHLLYARFWHKVLHDLGQVSTVEPFGRLFNQGYIQAFAYRDSRGVAVPADEVVDELGRPAAETPDRAGARFTWRGQPVTQEYGKMGKSLKNATSPDDVCAQYGCDTLRLYEMYMGPLDASKPWNPRDIIGPHRFLQRLWRLAIDEETGEPRLSDRPDAALELTLHRTIARVGDDIQRMSFNTAIALLIELVNAATSGGGSLTRSQLKRLVLITAPFAPHVAEELWSRLGHNRSLAAEPWPAHDPAMLVESTIELPVQVDGKVRARVSVPADSAPGAIEAAALADERVRGAIAGRSVKKVVVVPGKIVNIVVG